MALAEACAVWRPVKNRLHASMWRLVAKLAQYLRVSAHGALKEMAASARNHGRRRVVEGPGEK